MSFEPIGSAPMAKAQLPKAAGLNLIYGTGPVKGGERITLSARP